MGLVEKLNRFVKYPVLRSYLKIAPGKELGPVELKYSELVPTSVGAMAGNSSEPPGTLFNTVKTGLPRPSKVSRPKVPAPNGSLLVRMAVLLSEKVKMG